MRVHISKHIPLCFPHKITMSLDIVFVKGKKGEPEPQVVELNGAESGIDGMCALTTISKEERAAARVRGRPNLAFVKLIAQHGVLWSELQELEKKSMNQERAVHKAHVSDQLRELERAIHITPHFKHAHVNHPFFSMALDDKSQLEYMVPCHLLPQSYNFSSPTKSETGLWIKKPPHGRCGEGIVVLTDEHMQSEKVEPNYVYQELREQMGAQCAGKTLEGNPACMRLLLDVTIAESGSVAIDYQGAYQRVSRYNAKDTSATLEDIYVVNLRKGAYAVQASVAEVEAGLECAEQVLQCMLNRFDRLHERVVHWTHAPSRRAQVMQFAEMLVVK
jgi:hypothetical protein